MLMALTAWLLGLAGVHPSADDIARYEREYRERGHHVTLNFGGQRLGGTRWRDPDWVKSPIIGIGYEYRIDRPYNGVGFEVVGQSIGSLLKGGKSDNSFFVGGGLNYYPIRHVRVFMQAGPQIPLEGQTVGVGRFGLGYQFMFFKVGMEPYAFYELRTDGQPAWALAFRFVY
jgi:hypothetical protein